MLHVLFSDNGIQKIMSCERKEKEMSERHILERALADGATPVRARLPRHWKEFVCGGGAAFCNILISYPLNKLIFRQVS